MAFGHGKKGRVLLGAYDVSAFLKDFGGGQSIDMADVTTITKNSKCYLVGAGDGKVSLGGFFAGAAAELNDILNTFKAAAIDWPYLVAFQGHNAVGNRARIGQGKLAEHEVSGTVSDAVQASCEIQTSDYDEMGGIILADLAQRASTSQATSVDNGAASSNGGIAVVHNTQFATLTNVVIKVQHSTDNSAWSDLVTFTTLTAIGAEAKEVAAGTTVNRYLRAQWTISGSGTFTAAVAFARR